MASKIFWLEKILQRSRCKSGTVIRPVSICKAEQGTSLPLLTEKRRRFPSFREAESMLLHYLVLMHAASGYPHISFFLESAFPLLTIRYKEASKEVSFLLQSLVMWTRQHFVCGLQITSYQIFHQQGLRSYLLMIMICILISSYSN